jgi:predicted phosphodiesterase
LLRDFEIIIHEFEQNNDITIIPISDVHLGANEHMQREWELFCLDVLKEPNTYITLGGDLINNATRSSVSNIFEETMRPSEQKRLMSKMLEPLRSRILCAVSGNHERRSTKDVDDEPTYDIMCKLDLEHLYRENLAFVKLRIGDQKGNGSTNPTYTLAVTHGAGGGALSGGTVNRNERFGYAIEGVDALIVGHSHKPIITQPAKLVVDHANNKISVKPFKVVVSTAWLGYGGYAAQKMLIPGSHAMQKITLAGKQKLLTVTM